MTRMTAAVTAIFTAVLVLFSGASDAQTLNPQEKTYLTFSGPVELPGMTLPAGTYTFRLADTPTRNVVQVLSRDERTIHGQFLFVPTERRDVTGETVVTFRETAEGTSPAVRYWFYPGESTGKEFVYPQDQAMRIASRTGTPVLTSEGSTADSRVSAVDQTGRLTPFEPEPAPAQPQANSAAQAPSGAAIPAQPERQFAAAELPQTASSLPLASLIGFMSLAGALGLRAIRS